MAAIIGLSYGQEPKGWDDLGMTKTGASVALTEAQMAAIFGTAPIKWNKGDFESPAPPKPLGPGNGIGSLGMFFHNMETHHHSQTLILTTTYEMAQQLRDVVDRASGDAAQRKKYHTALRDVLNAAQATSDELDAMNEPLAARLISLAEDALGTDYDRLAG